MVKVDFRQNSKGRDILYLNNISFKKQSKHGEKVYWSCNKRQCKSKAHTIDDKLVFYDAKHCRRAHCKLKQKANNNNNNDDSKKNPKDISPVPQIKQINNAVVISDDDDDDDKPLITWLTPGIDTDAIKNRLVNNVDNYLKSNDKHSDQRTSSPTPANSSCDTTESQSTNISKSIENDSEASTGVPATLGYRKLKKIKKIKNMSSKLKVKDDNQLLEQDTSTSSTSSDCVKPEPSDDNENHNHTDNDGNVNIQNVVTNNTSEDISSCIEINHRPPSHILPLHQMAPYLYHLAQVVHSGKCAPWPTIARDDPTDLMGASSSGGGSMPGVDESNSSPDNFIAEVMEREKQQSPTIPQMPNIPPIAAQRPESYKLCHNNHLSLVLEALAADDSFMDVTLTAQGKSLKAHKSVLSAVSPYFRSVLKENPCQHPIIIMPRDIKYEELSNIISYVYRGEMTVATEELSSLLKTAEILQVTGLSPSESAGMGGVSGSTMANQTLQDQIASLSPSPSVSLNQNTNNEMNNQQQADCINPTHFMDVDFSCVKEEITNLEECLERSNQNTNQVPKVNKKVNNPTNPTDNNITKSPTPTNGQEKSSNSPPISPKCEENPNDSPTVEDTSPSPYLCPYCESTSPFRDYDTLTNHLRLKHQSKPAFVCNTCCRVYRKNTTFNEHVRLCVQDDML